MLDISCGTIFISTPDILVLIKFLLTTNHFQYFVRKAVNCYVKRVTMKNFHDFHNNCYHFFQDCVKITTGPLFPLTTNIISCILKFLLHYLHLFHYFFILNFWLYCKVLNAFCVSLYIFSNIGVNWMTKWDKLSYSQLNSNFNWLFIDTNSIPTNAKSIP